MQNSSIVRAAVLLLLACGYGLAQDSHTAGQQAVIAFMNILDNDVVRAMEQTSGPDLERLAADLVTHLEERAVLAPDIAEAMRSAVRGGALLPRGAFVLYLADLLNGAQPLDTRLVEGAEAMIRRLYCDLTIPPGEVLELGADPVLDHLDVGHVVEQFLDNAECIAPGLREGYQKPVT